VRTAGKGALVSFGTQSRSWRSCLAEIVESKTRARTTVRNASQIKRSCRWQPRLSIGGVTSDELAITRRFLQRLRHGAGEAGMGEPHCAGGYYPLEHTYGVNAGTYGGVQFLQFACLLSTYVQDRQASDLFVVNRARHEQVASLVEIQEIAHVRILEVGGLLGVKLWTVGSVDQQRDAIPIELHSYTRFEEPGGVSGAARSNCGASGTGCIGPVCGTVPGICSAKGEPVFIRRPWTGQSNGLRDRT
jgi:hypothetical protein